MNKYVDKETVRRIINSERSKEQMLTMLDNMPTADVRENVRGKWIYTTHYGERYRVCPKCNMERKDDFSSGWNFCPNCGAELKG